MRILYWSESFPPEIGGAALASARLLQALRARGHTFHIVAGAEAEGEGSADFHGVPVSRYPFRSKPGLAHFQALLRIRERLAAEVGHFQPDILHVACGMVSLPLALDLSRRARRPLLLTLHRFWPDQRLAPDATLGQALRHAEAVVCVSERLCEEVRARVPACAETCRYIPNFVERAAAPAAMPWAPPRLLCVARLAEEKNLHLALRAFSRLHAERPELRLIIAGDGPARASLELLSTELGLDGAVDFRGWVAPDQVPALMRDATIVLIPSQTEALPLTALEAAAAARPVVASRVGGLPEVVDDGSTGRLVAPGDVDAMVDAIRSLLDDRTCTGRLGAQALERVRAHYSPAHATAAYAALYEMMHAKERPDAGA